MPRSAEGKSVGKPGEVASLSHLNPAGTVGRVRDDLACSRRASAYRLVGQHRAPLNGHVLSELYQVHESALSFQRALPARASAIFYRPEKQPSGSGGRPHSGNAGAGT